MKEKKHKKEKECNTNNNTSMINCHSKKYDPSWINEYKMMREELVNYMEKLQEIRNMMYITLGAVFAFSISQELPFLCSLLPLLFILPAYVIAVNYWVCVRKASAYLVVFHESYEDCPIHWESRHNMLKKISRKNENFSKSTVKNVAPQLISYYACASITMIVYILRLCKYVNDKMQLEENDTLIYIKIDGIPILWYIIIAIIITICLLIFFVIFSIGESYDSFLKKFILIKNKEGQSVIGKYWPKDMSGEENNESLLEISKVVNKYL